MQRQIALSAGVLSIILVGAWFWMNQTPALPQETTTNTSGVPAAEGTDINTKEATKTEVSFATLFDKTYSSGPLAIGGVIEEGTSYTKSNVTYQSEGLTISGAIYVPKGQAPAEGWPVLITNHGYIDPAIYTTGRGLKREQGYFANKRYVVLHPDYRGHAGSTKTNEDPIKMRLGYVTDIIHAVLALEQSTVPVNKNKVAMLGHSMGGGASLAAAIVKPDLVEKVILYAPVSLNYLDSYERYMNDDLERKNRVVSVYGTPEQNPGFWTGLNGEPYINRLIAPVQIYHGTSDDDVPLAWSENTKMLLEKEGKQIDFIVYPGEEHEFGPEWSNFMAGVAKFIQ